MFERKEIVMKNDFLEIKKWEKEDQVYYYAERRGVDSVAFVLQDKKTGKVGLISEFKPPIDKFVVTAFGGSLDKDLSHEEIVKEEVLEEAGYEGVSLSYAGSAFVSTQMNQWCHLYLVDVTHAQEVGRRPQTKLEEIATVEWMWPAQVKSLFCWKAITILTKMGVI